MLHLVTELTKKVIYFFNLLKKNITSVNKIYYSTLDLTEK